MGEGLCRVGRQMGLRVEQPGSPVTGVTPAREGPALPKPEIAQDTMKTPQSLTGVPAGAAARLATSRRKPGAPMSHRHVQGKFVCKHMWDILGDLQKYLRGTLKEAEVSVSRW